MKLRITFSVTALAIVSSVSWARAAQPIGVIVGDQVAFTKELQKKYEANLRSAGVGAELLTQSPGPNKLAWANAARRLDAYEAGLIVGVIPPIDLELFIDNCCTSLVYIGEARGSLPEPTERVTGVVWQVPIASGVNYLKQMGAQRIAVVGGREGPDFTRLKKEAEAAQSSVGVATAAVLVRNKRDVGNLAGYDAIFADGSCSRKTCLDPVLKHAAENRMPTAAAVPGAEESGAILTMQPDPEEVAELAAKMSVLLLKGAEPAKLKFAVAKKVMLTVHFKESQKLGLQVPTGILSSAARVLK